MCQREKESLRIVRSRKNYRAYSRINANVEIMYNESFGNQRVQFRRHRSTDT